MSKVKQAMETITQTKYAGGLGNMTQTPDAEPC